MNFWPMKRGETMAHALVQGPNQVIKHLSTAVIQGKISMDPRNLCAQPTAPRAVETHAILPIRIVTVQRHLANARLALPEATAKLIYVVLQDAENTAVAPLCTLEHLENCQLRLIKHVSVNQGGQGHSAITIHALTKGERVPATERASLKQVPTQSVSATLAFSGTIANHLATASAQEPFLMDI